MAIADSAGITASEPSVDSVSVPLRPELAFTVLVLFHHRHFQLPASCHPSTRQAYNIKRWSLGASVEGCPVLGSLYSWRRRLGRTGRQVDERVASQGYSRRISHSYPTGLKLWRTAHTVWQAICRIVCFLGARVPGDV